MDLGLTTSAQLIEGSRMTKPHIMELMFDDGEWCRFPFIFIRENTFTLGEAVMLSALINLYNLGKKKSKNGWIVVTNKALKSQGFSLYQINQFVPKLKAKKVVQIKATGVPPKRRIRIDFDELEHLFSNICKSRDSNIGKSRSLSSRSSKKGKKLSERIPTEKKWARFAGKLRTSLQTHRKVHPTSTAKAWGEHFRKLHTTDKVPIKHIKIILNWYCQQIAQEGDIIKNGNTSYLPVVFSGAAFRKKFNQLEEAMRRHAKKNGVGAAPQYDEEAIERKKAANLITEEEEAELEGLTVQELEERGIYDRDY
jgi:hypothetical protein